MTQSPQPQGTKENETTRASLELLYHISRELTSALELRTVLERVLFLSMRNVKAIRGSIIVMDDTERPIESAVIAGDQVMDRNTQRLRATLERGLAGWVVRNRQSVLISNTAQDERWMLQQYELADRSEAKSAVSVPLMVRERLVGVITLVHPKAGFFTSEHLSLVQAIADQASIAVLNARYYEESQRQVRVMTALAETAAVVTGSLNLEEVFLRILEKITQALSVQAVCIAMLDAGGQRLAVRAASGWLKTYSSKTYIQPGRSIAGWVAKEGKALVVHEALSDERYDPETEQRTGLGIRAIACAPLKYRNQIIGVIEAINPTDGVFDADVLLLLTGIGSLAGTAVRHAQLFERLQAAHQSYRELFEDSIDPIIITDWQGKIVEANRIALLTSGYEKETLRSMAIGQLHAIDLDMIGSDFERLNTKRTLTYESRLRTHPGHEIPVQVYVHSVDIEGVGHIQWILRDITERKNLDSMRDDLISMIYHDLRSPLANVVSSLEIMNTMPPIEEDETMSSLVNIALRSTERIQRLTNSLLDMSRLEAGQPLGNRQPQALHPILQEAYELVKPLTDSKEQALEMKTSTQLPAVLVDGEMIRRVVVNLLENASKYSSTGSPIELGALVDDEWVKVWIQDNGPGIPAAEQHRIFTKFTRLVNREKTKGLGLGLAFCRMAVEAHGGRIWVESEPGKGSKFSFVLPQAPADDLDEVNTNTPEGNE
jgi:PAS domain S-box-containing protein